MRKLFLIPGVACMALLAMAVPAQADHKFRCEGVHTGVTVRDVNVPRDASAA